MGPGPADEEPPLTFETIAELAALPDRHQRQFSLYQAMGRLEVEAQVLSRRRAEARRAAVAADESRDRAREVATRREAALPKLIEEAEAAEKLAVGAEERAEALMVAAVNARRNATERAAAVARARDQASKSRKDYDAAQAMHERAFILANRAKVSLAESDAEIKARKREVCRLLGVAAAPNGGA